MVYSVIYGLFFGCREGRRRDVFGLKVVFIMGSVMGDDLVLRIVMLLLFSFVVSFCVI